MHDTRCRFKRSTLSYVHSCTYAHSHSCTCAHENVYVPMVFLPLPLPLPLHRILQLLLSAKASLERRVGAALDEAAAGADHAGVLRHTKLLAQLGEPQRGLARCEQCHTCSNMPHHAKASCKGPHFQCHPQQFTACIGHGWCVLSNEAN